MNNSLTFFTHQTLLASYRYRIVSVTRVIQMMYKELCYVIKYYSTAVIK